MSSKTGVGLDDLRDGIADFLIGGSRIATESVMLTEQRHYEVLLACSEALARVSDSQAAGVSLEFWAVDLREALHYLGQISGETTTEDVLTDIFSGFCIGK